MKNANIVALGHEVDHGRIKMNPLYYAPPYNMTCEKPKETDIRKIKERRENAKNDKGRR